MFLGLKLLFSGVSKHFRLNLRFEEENVEVFTRRVEAAMRSRTFFEALLVQWPDIVA